MIQKYDYVSYNFQFLQYIILLRTFKHNSNIKIHSQEERQCYYNINDIDFLRVMFITTIVNVSY